MYTFSGLHFNVLLVVTHRKTPFLLSFILREFKNLYQKNLFLPGLLFEPLFSKGYFLGFLLRETHNWQCHWGFKTYSLFNQMLHLPLSYHILREFNNTSFRGSWVAQSVKHLPSAQVMISGPGIRPHIRLPAQQGVCLSLSICLSPSRCSLTLSLSLS